MPPEAGFRPVTCIRGMAGRGEARLVDHLEAVVGGISALILKFPENREFNREFLRIRPFRAFFVSNRSDKSKACTPIP
jgi:hypothetical protein